VLPSSLPNDQHRYAIPTTTIFLVNDQRTNAIQNRLCSQHSAVTTSPCTASENRVQQYRRQGTETWYSQQATGRGLSRESRWRCRLQNRSKYHPTESNNQP